MTAATHTSKRKLSWTAFLAIAALFFAVVCLLVLHLRSSQLNAAQNRWKARSFDRYRMVTHFQGDRECSAEYMVEGDDITSITSSPGPGTSCGAERTIPELFHTISDPQPECFPTGIHCFKNIVMGAEYDPLLGYPKRIHVYHPIYSDYLTHPVPLIGWRRLTIGFSDYEFTVESLTPLP